jgi:uncharacterized phiE125 gp8 family phage protein
MTPAMNLQRVTQPLYEPVNVDDLMQHSRIDSDAEYTYVLSLIQAAREHVEDELRRTLMPTTWEWTLDAWPAVPVEIPRAPLRSIVSIRYTDEDGVEATYSSANYYIDTGSEPGRLMLKPNADWPAVDLQAIAGVKIRYVAGYADLLDADSTQAEITAARNAIPMRHRQAIRLIAAHLYENREEVTMGAGLTPAQLPLGVSALLMPTRVIRF